MDVPSPQPPRWHLLDVLFAGIALTFFAAGGLYSILKPPAPIPFPGLRSLLPGLLITPTLALLLLLCRATLSQAPLSAFLGTPTLRSIGQGLLFGLLAFPLLSLLSYVISSLAAHFGLSTPLQNAALWLLSSEMPPLSQGVLILHITLLAPIAEEILFRGVLLSAFSRLQCPLLGVVLTSLLFGLCHGNLLAFLPTALLGALLAILSLRKKSLIPNIACHITFNFANLLLIYLLPPSLSSAL